MYLQLTEDQIWTVYDFCVDKFIPEDKGWCEYYKALDAKLLIVQDFGTYSYQIKSSASTCYNLFTLTLDVYNLNIHRLKLLCSRGNKHFIDYVRQGDNEVYKLIRELNGAVMY